MFLLLLGVLALILFMISSSLFFILAIPSLVWLFRTRRAIKRYSETDDWLDIEPKLKKAGNARKSLPRMAAWEFRNKSKRMKILLLSVTLIFIVATSWLIWEIFPFRFYSHTVNNDDTRVFNEVVFDQVTQSLTIKGSNTPLLDTRMCRVHFMLPFKPNMTGKANISSCWNLNYEMTGSSILTVEHWIYLERSGILNVVLYSSSSESNVNEVNTIRCINSEIDYTCYDNFEYQIGVALSVWLTGFSSVEATLEILNLNATTY